MPFPEEEQVYVRFPKEVTQILQGNYNAQEETVVPLFRELPAADEVAFREHARDNYQIGTPISTVFHPIWQDEARRMNREADPAFGS